MAHPDLDLGGGILRQPRKSGVVQEGGGEVIRVQHPRHALAHRRDLRRRVAQHALDGRIDVGGVPAEQIADVHQVRRGRRDLLEQPLALQQLLGARGGIGERSG
jgi:hypothetical protein